MALSGASEPYYFPVEVKERWGYIDQNGKIVIKPSYKAAAHFTEGLAPVKVDGQFGYIGRQGSIVIRPQFDEARFFYKGVAPVRKGKLWGYIDTKGEFKIPLHSKLPGASRMRSRVCG